MHPGRPPRREGRPDDRIPAIFVGGPRDGKKLNVNAYDKTIFTFDLPKPYWGNSCAPAVLTDNYVTTYERVALTPGGVAIFEERRPREVSTNLEIEIVHVPQADPKMIRNIVEELVPRIAGDYRAFSAGIKSAKLKDS
jgi:hypothetical protein